MQRRGVPPHPPNKNVCLPACVSVVRINLESSLQIVTLDETILEMCQPRWTSWSWLCPGMRQATLRQPVTGNWRSTSGWPWTSRRMAIPWHQGSTKVERSSGTDCPPRLVSDLPCTEESRVEWGRTHLSELRFLERDLRVVLSFLVVQPLITLLCQLDC